MLVAMEDMLINRYHYYSKSAEDDEFLKKMNELFDDYRKNLTNKNYDASEAIILPQVYQTEDRKNPEPSPARPRGERPQTR